MMQLICGGRLIRKVGGIFSRIGCCVLLLLLAACGGGGGSGPAPATSGGLTPNLSDVSVYEANSPYAAVLKGCATASDQADLCTLGTLPLIGHDAPNPTVADVMDRVLVSQPWMGDRFEEVLNQLPPDILTLFKGVTAIVIDGDVNPPYYSAERAAVYLDPADLWLTNAEKATVSDVPDFRAHFGDALNFIPLWRYVKNGNYAYNYYPLDGTETRQLSDILYPMARQLYHELGHANDFLPPSAQPTLDPSMTPYQEALAVEGDSVAAHLETAFPLTSQLWLDLAKVLYHGATPTSAQIDYTPDQVGSAFAGDVASDPYNYASAREDVAMLFEETMMKYHFGIDRDIAFTDVPTTDTPSCDDYVVRWGERGRIGDPTVKPRAALVAAQLLPGSDLSTFFAGLPAPTPMNAGLGWCSNLSLGAAAPAGLAPAWEVSPAQVQRDRRPPE